MRWNESLTFSSSKMDTTEKCFSSKSSQKSSVPDSPANKCKSSCSEAALPHQTPKASPGGICDKDRNCDVCLRTTITRVACRRRSEGSIPNAVNFVDLITADNKFGLWLLHGLRHPMNQQMRDLRNFGQQWNLPHSRSLVNNNSSIRPRA